MTATPGVATSWIEMPIDYTDGYRVVVEWEDGEGACWQASLAGLNEVNQGRMTQTCAMGFGATKEAALLDLCCALAATLDAFSTLDIPRDAPIQEWFCQGCGNMNGHGMTAIPSSCMRCGLSPCRRCGAPNYGNNRRGMCPRCRAQTSRAIPELRPLPDLPRDDPRDDTKD